MRFAACFRLFSVAILAALALSVLGAASPAGAQSARGSIVIHPRICPLNMPAGSLLFDQCHDHPGPDGVEFTVDDRVPKGMDSHGNVSFGRVTAGDHLVTLTSDFQPNEFLKVRAFCSNVTLGSGPNEAFIRSGDQADFWVRVGVGSRLVCDVYFIPISGR
jgi:hypothetical protein